MPGLKQALSAIAVVSAMFIVGCGGAGDSASTPPVTKAEFIKRADLICRRADVMQHRTLDALIAKDGKELNKLTPVVHEEKVVRVITLPSVRREIREIEALESPDGEGKKVNAIIAGFNLAVRKGEKNPYSVAAWWQPAKDPFTQINKVAVRYGFNDCRDLR